MSFIWSHIPLSISTADLDAKANVASPTFTGDPRAPTPTAGDSDTSIATTAFVATSFAPKANASFTGSFEVNGNQIDVVSGGGVGINTAGSGGVAAGDTTLQVAASSGQTAPVIFSSAGFTNNPTFRVKFGNSFTGISVPASCRFDIGNEGVNNQMICLTSAGRLGLWTTGATAWLHLKAGDAAASGAPLKFNDGVLLTSPEAGAVECDVDQLFFTGTTTVKRKALGFDPALNVNTTQVGNVGAGEDDLMTYSVAASQLDANNQSISFTASGSIANNVNAKRIRVKFGSTTILDTGAAGIPASAAIDYVITGRIIRTGAATQIIHVSMVTNNATFPGFAAVTAGTETLSGALTLKLTGEATTNDDITQKTMTVDWVRGI